MALSIRDMTERDIEGKARASWAYKEKSGVV